MDCEDRVSDQLTPVDIKNREFKKTLWGYSPHEVILFLDSVAKTWERVQAREQQLQAKLLAIGNELDSWKNKERELELIRASALGEAEKIRAAATDHGKKLLEEARQQSMAIQGKTQDWLAVVIAELQTTERRRQKLAEELRQKLDEHFSLLETKNGAERPLEEQLAQFLDSRKENQVSA